MFARLPEEPANGLLQEVVQGLGLLQKEVSNGIGVVQLTVTDELHRAHHPDALLPNGLPITSKVVKHGSVFVQEPRSEQFIARQIH